MRRLALAIALVLALAAPRAAAQSNWISVDYDFAEYLIDTGLKKDAAALLGRDIYRQSDTLTFLRGWTAYQLQDLAPALELLRAVPDESAFADKSFFYGNAVSAHMGEYAAPAALLEAYDGPYKELRGLQMAGLALLQDDPEAFKRASADFGYADFALVDAERKLDEIYDWRYVRPAKSPLLAAAASAVVPGLGKVYAGRVGEGIESFLLTGISGAIAAEHWIKDGPRDWKTIAATAVCAVLYIGNIYGSYVSVSIYNNNLKDAQDTAILYNIHIPLRAVFK
ncbi:MAG: hypothetical protein IK031_07510 [Bacteroidales bacterium]|nr:hypothetical protein [Bacteroidales bacterium]